MFWRMAALLSVVLIKNAQIAVPVSGIWTDSEVEYSCSCILMLVKYVPIPQH